MEVFTGNIKSIIQELKSLEKEILTCQTPSKLVPLLYSYYSFIHIYNVYSHKNYFTDIKVNKYLLQDSQKMIEILSKSRTQEFLKTKSTHTTFALEMMDTMLDCLHEIKPLKHQWIGKYSFLQIFSQFSEQEDKTLKENMHALSDEQRICYLKQINPKTFGSTILNFQNNKNYIWLYTPFKYELNSLFTLCHELGHIEDFQNLFNNHSSYEMYAYHMQSFYVEVLAMKKEKEVIEYLIKHDIQKDKAKSYLNKYYLDIFSFLNQMLILSLFDEKDIDSGKYLQYTRKDIQKLLTQKGINSHHLLLSDHFDIDDEVIYSYGGILAIYFSYLAKNDPKRYQENFHQFLHLQTEPFNPNHLEQMGTTMEELKKVVKQEMMEFIPKTKTYKK